MVTKENFLLQLSKGHEGELAIEGVLQWHGWYTFPTYHYRSEQQKSPRLKNGKTSYVSPDIDACKNGRRIWVECKLEEGASWTYSLKRMDHGFALKYYEHYLKVQEITGCPVWIFFLEYDQVSRTKKDIEECRKKGRHEPPLIKYPENMLRGQLLSKLSPRHNPNRQMNADYVYFNQKDFLYFGVVREGFYLLPISDSSGDITDLDVLE